jgi:pimeloyl-ACP methyl ester carboxylesterase
MSEDRPAVVLVHGIWMKGLEMWLLGRRLARAGYHVYRFSYRSLARDAEANARRLNRFLQRLDEPTVHIVAHSLGGLIVRRLFHDFPEQRPGRIVTLGTPHQGSLVAERMAHHSLLRRMLGRSRPVLTGECCTWSGQRELGSIAGNRALGIGRLFGKMPMPNDGTVTLDSTRLENMHDHIVVAASHMGMLFSHKAAGQVIAFLARGRFEHENNG